MNVYALSALTAVLGDLIIGTIVLLKAPKKKQNIVYWLMSLTIGLWAFGCFGQSFFLSPPKLIIFFDKLIYTGAIIAPILYLLLIVTMLKRESHYKHRLRFFTLLTLGFLVINWVDPLRYLLIDAIDHRYSFRYAATPGPLWLAFFAYYSLISSFVLAELYLGFKQATKKALPKLYCLLIATTCLAIGGYIYLCLILNLHIPQVDNVFHILYAIIMGYAITKHQLMDITATINRVGSHLIVYAILLSTLTVSFIYLPHYLALFVIFMLCVLASKYGELLRQTLQTTADKKWVKEWYNPSESLQNLTHNLQAALDRRSIFHTTAVTISEALDIDAFAYLYLDTSVLNTQEYTQVNKNESTTYAIHANHPLIKYCSHYLRPIRIQDIPPDHQHTLQEFLSTKQGILLPLYSPEQLEGIILFGERASEAPFKDKELDFFTLTQSTLNIYLERIRPYEKIKQQYENILKKDTVLTTIATLNQEVNAPLQAVFCSTFLLKKELIHSDNEAIRKSLSGIEEDLGKIRLIVKRLMGIIRAEDKKE